MAYGTSCQVFSLVRSLVLPSTCFSGATCPTLTDVEDWLTTGCAVINTHLSARGYAAPGASTAIYEMLGQANALWAAAMAEDSRVNARISAEERTRGDRFRSQFNALMKTIGTLDLGRAGLGQTSVAYAGGVSRSNKETVESDSDRVTPRFRRGDGKNPDAGGWDRENSSAS